MPICKIMWTARNNLWLAGEFLRYVRKAKNEYGIHSPFVYRLVTECLYDKTRYPDYVRLKAYRKNLLQDQTPLSVTDPGAGSRKFSGSTRPISRMVRTAGSPLKKMKWLYRCARYFEIRNALELGSHLGLGLYPLALAMPEAEITGIEGDPALHRFTSKLMKEKGVENIRLVYGRFDDVLPEILQGQTFDLIHLDGNHTKEATLCYMEKIKPHIHDNTLILVDDIRWSPGMYEAWREIVNDPFFHVSIDLFRMGMVFKRHMQQKEHFIIRF